MTVQLGDVLAIPAVGERAISSITQIREDRFAVRLDKKFEPSVVIDVVTHALGRARPGPDVVAEPAPQVMDMIGNALYAGDSVAVPEMRDDQDQDRPVIVVRVIREVRESGLLWIEREPVTEGADGEDAKNVVKVASSRV